MDFRSRLATVSKRDRALVLSLALAELLASAGERVGLLGESDPILARNAAERLAVFLARATPAPAGPATAPPLHRCRAGRRLPRPAGRDRGPARRDRPLGGARASDPGRSTRSRRPSPTPGGPNSSIPRPGSRHVVGRAEQYRDDYQARLAALRERLALHCRRLDWTFLVHRTDRPATEPLLALHARLADRQALGGSAGAYAA